MACFVESGLEIHLYVMWSLLCLFEKRPIKKERAHEFESACSPVDTHSWRGLELDVGDREI